jgi:hypothetical protein
MTTKEKTRACFVVCISNKDYPSSLEVGKLYKMIPDQEAESHGYFRVIDESGEDYGYNKDRFFPIQIPTELEEALLKAA